MEEAKNDKETKLEKLIKQYGPLKNFNNFEEKNNELNKEYTVYRHDYRMFLTEEELKDRDLSDLPELSI